MSDHSADFDRLFDLVGAVCDEDASQDQLVELDSIAIADQTACRRYLGYCRMHSTLRLELRARRATRKIHQQIESEFTAQSPGDCDAVPTATLPASTSSSLPYTIVASFSSGWPVAYLVATVMCGIGLVIGALIHVSDPRQVVNDSSPIPAEYRPESQPNAQSIGRITGMVDCRWSDPRTATVHGAHVASGRKYALAAGLLEITYDTGAKVILQGPVTYAVDSKNGGSLTIGKMTGIVATETARGFAVRTPTAIVTDLGTEFGVEVDKTGATQSHVFRGTVRLQPVAVKGELMQPMILGVNESARVEIGMHQVPLMRRVPAKPDGFVCQMPKPPARLLLRDTFDNPVDSHRFDDCGLNQYLQERQSGRYRPVIYLPGGDFADRTALVQVAHPACPGKLSQFTDCGNAGWVVLNRMFPRDLVVSAELDPVALRALDQKSPVPKTVIGDMSSENWMALGVRGCGCQFQHKELPLASDAGAVIRVRSNGNWSYSENGTPIAHGRVSAAHPYTVVMRVLDDQLEAAINGVVLDLDPNRMGAPRTLTGQAAKNKGDSISLGAGNVLATAPSSGIDLNSVDNLTITEARPGAFTEIVSRCSGAQSEPSNRKEPPANVP